MKTLTEQYSCPHCGGDHDGVHMLPIECEATTKYACPWCGAKPGEPCIDVRVHRKRKLMIPAFKEKERRRSAQR